MTQWQEPDEPPAPATDATPDGTDAAPAGSDASGPASVSRVARRQMWLLALAGVLITAVVVLLAVVLLRGSGGPDRPAKGSPEAFTDQVASALAARTAQPLGILACGSSRAAVLSAARTVVGRVAHADRQGSVQQRDELAVARIRLRATGRPDSVATIALRRAAGTANGWCLQLLSVAVPQN